MNTIVGDENSFRLWKMKSKVVLKNPPKWGGDTEKELQLLVLGGCSSTRSHGLLRQCEQSYMYM